MTNSKIQDMAEEAIPKSSGKELNLPSEKTPRWDKARLVLKVINI